MQAKIRLIPKRFYEETNNAIPLSCPECLIEYMYYYTFVETNKGLSLIHWTHPHITLIRAEDINRI